MALRGALGSGLGARDATFVSRGRRGTWQAWHNLTSTFVSRGRRGTILHPPSFRVAGVALMALRGALGSGLGARDAAAFCVAGVAQPYIHLRFTWQAWHNLTSTFVSRGRRGTHGTPWRAWVWFGRAWRRGILRGRRGTTLHPPSFHVASVAQSYIHLRFAWQAWHNLTSTFVSRGKRGTILHPPSFRVAGVALMALRGALGSGLGARDAAAFCVAGVAQPYIHLRFTWQAWHNLTSTFVSRGRRGTHGTPCRAWVWFGRAHTYIHTYIRNIHTYIPTVLPSRSFTTSFVFPSFPVPAKTIEAHYWKKLTCGVIRSFNFCNTLAVFKAHNTLNSKNTLHLHFRSDLHVRWKQGQHAAQH